VVDGETKSIGREVTFERDIIDAAPILETMDGLAEEICSELLQCGFRFRTITVKIRFEHFDTFTRSRSLAFATKDLAILRNNGRRLVDLFLRRQKRVRLIGLRVSALNRL
jgi:DNA polymerase IV (DinB-like DNA polymerase)